MIAHVHTQVAIKDFLSYSPSGSTVGEREMASSSDLIVPMFGPMAIWICISAVFGPFQVWMGASKCRRRQSPPPPWSDCVMTSLADGNLFIFAIGTAGGVLAVALMEFYHGHGELYRFRGVGIVLIIASLLIIVLAAHAWTDAKSAHSAQGGHRGSQQALLVHAIHGTIDPRDVHGSIRYGFMAFTCALMTEGLRLVEALNLI